MSRQAENDVGIGIVRPGDRLIIQCDPDQTLEKINEFHERLDQALAPIGVEFILITTRQILVVPGSESCEIDVTQFGGAELRFMPKDAA